MANFYLLDVMNRKFHEINEDFSIGRVQGDLIIKDPGLSSKHCRIYLEDEEYYLEDLESSNGTYLNRKKIKDDIALDDFDQIVVGQQKFIFTSTQDIEEIKNGLKDFGDETSVSIFSKLKSLLKKKK